MEVYDAIQCNATLCPRFAATDDCPSDALPVECDASGVASLTLVLPPTSNATTTSASLSGAVGQLTSLTSLVVQGALTGSLPPQLGALVRLAELRVQYGGALQGSLPSSLGALSQLTALALDYNGLGGSLPSELARLTLLRSLQLASNKLTGSLEPVRTLVQLATLDFDTNALSGPIDAVSGLTALEALFLSHNAFDGTLPAAAFGGMSRLHTLVLSNNALTGSIGEALASAAALVSLDLSFNALSGGVPSALSKLPLTKLLLMQNRLTGVVANEFLTIETCEIRTEESDSNCFSQCPLECCVRPCVVKGNPINMADDAALFSIHQLVVVLAAAVALNQQW